MSYAEAVCGEIASRSLKDMISSAPNTLYFGGGTPSLLPPAAIGLILNGLESVGFRPDFDEFTLEVNPDDIVSKGEAYVRELLDLGVNRVSMGIQSFDDSVLRWMRRRHDAATAVRAYEILREAGVENISVDLMFGMSLLTPELWSETLDRVLSLPGGLPEHISAYQLSVEPGSALAAQQAGGGLAEAGAGEGGPAAAESRALASEEVCAEQYARLCDRLRAAGYEHYEISNFALPGRRAVHNSAYWSGSSYIGLGPGAHSYDAVRGVRSWNRDSVADYLAAFSSAEPLSGAAEEQDRSTFETISESETLSSEQLDIERVMLALRTADGISYAELERISGADKIAAQLRSGNLEPAHPVSGERRLRIPESRFFVSDSIIADCLPD